MTNFTKRKFLWIVLILNIFVFEQISYAASSDPQTFINHLVLKSQEIEKRKDLKPLQSLVSGSLVQWYVPGVCWVFQKEYKVSELQGWLAKTDSLGTQDPLLLLTMVFHSLKLRPLIVLESKKFNPYVPGACEKDERAKKQKWYKHWVLYPGDYILDRTENACPASEVSYPTVQKTLLYFREEGQNFYFGLRQKDGKWILQSVGMDTDCDA